MNKKELRLKRARRCRAKIRELNVPRICVNRTLNHIYAQIILPEEQTVVASASTAEKEIKKEVSKTGNIDAAVVVGKLIAERGLKAGITKVAFDRSGFRYHGRVKALAEAAREAGLEF